MGVFNFWIWTTISFIVILVLYLCVVGCTVSFQNISTHGTATDLVDENQTPTATTTTQLKIPFTGT